MKNSAKKALKHIWSEKSQAYDFSKCNFVNDFAANSRLRLVVRREENPPQFVVLLDKFPST